MTKVNLVLTNYLTGITADKKKLEAANAIKKLLEKIDYKSEMVPENNLEMFTKLIVSLKGEPINTDEAELLKEIVMY